MGSRTTSTARKATNLEEAISFTKREREREREDLKEKVRAEEM